MRLSNIIERNQNKEQVKEDLLRWKRKLQKQRDYCNEKIAEINKLLAEEYHFADIASLYPDWMYMDTDSVIVDTDGIGKE